VRTHLRAVAAVLLLASCSSAVTSEEANRLDNITVPSLDQPGPSDTTAAPGPDSSPDSTAPTSTGSIEWGPCDDPKADDEALECATLTVPLNYEAPDGETVDLALVRAPANGDRQGAILFNPGGPGASGFDPIAINGTFIQAEMGLDDFDLVGLAWVLAASAMWAGYIVTGHRVARLERGLGGLAIGLLAGSVVIAPFAVAGLGALTLVLPRDLGALVTGLGDRVHRGTGRHHERRGDRDRPAGGTDERPDPSAGWVPAGEVAQHDHREHDDEEDECDRARRLTELGVVLQRSRTVDALLQRFAASGSERNRSIATTPNNGPGARIANANCHPRALTK